MASKSNKVTEIEVVMRPIAELVPNPDNPREIKDEDIAALADSIKANPRYFKARPVILSDRTGVLMIIDGEQRTKAAQYNGDKEVPTILLSGLTKEAEDEIMVRGNTHAGRWSETKLRKWANELLHRWGAPKWNEVSEETLQGLFEAQKEPKPKPVFIVVEVPVGEDAEIVREALTDALSAWPKVKIK